MLTLPRYTDASPTHPYLAQRRTKAKKANAKTMTITRQLQNRSGYHLVA